MLLYPSSDMEDGPLTILLRRSDRSEIFPLIGQRSRWTWCGTTSSGPTVTTRIGGLRSTVRFRAGVGRAGLVLARPARQSSVPS